MNTDDDNQQMQQQMEEELRRREEYNLDTIHERALMEDASRSRHRERLAAEAVQVCSKHPERKHAGYLYEHRDGFYHRVPRCAECMESAMAAYADPKTYEESRRGNSYEYHGPEIMGSDGKYYREQRLI